MKISKLPADIQVLAKKNFIAERGFDPQPNYSIGSFTWCKTSEGYNFWFSYLDAAYYGVMATNIKLKKDAIRNSL